MMPIYYKHVTITPVGHCQVCVSSVTKLMREGSIPGRRRISSNSKGGSDDILKLVLIERYEHEVYGV